LDEASTYPTDAEKVLSTKESTSTPEPSATSVEKGWHTDIHLSHQDSFSLSTTSLRAEGKAFPLVLKADYLPSGYDCSYCAIESYQFDMAALSYVPKAKDGGLNVDISLVFQDKASGEQLPNGKSSVMSKCLLSFEGSEFVSIY
jgi:hypothetical protein